MPALRGHEWSYTLGTRTLTGITHTARELTMTVKILRSYDSMERMRRLSDADMSNGTPGTLNVDGEWECPAYITKNDVQSIQPHMVTTQLTIVLLGLWRRSSVTHLLYRDSNDSKWLDYQFDYPYDYMGMALGSTVVNDSLASMPVKLTIFGPISNPYIVIGTNRYQVNVEVPAGARLEIDGASEPKSVTLIRANGEHVNVFANAVRGTGRGSGSYVFEPLPPGVSGVTWAGQFDWDLELFEERSEPPWI
jgi:hypothetical protein